MCWNPKHRSETTGAAGTTEMKPPKHRDETTETIKTSVVSFRCFGGFVHQHSGCDVKWKPPILVYQSPTDAALQFLSANCTHPCIAHDTHPDFFDLITNWLLFAQTDDIKFIFTVICCFQLILMVLFARAKIWSQVILIAAILLWPSYAPQLWICSLMIMNLKHASR